MLELPERVRDIANALHKADGKCFLVGGYVRDLELGVQNKDIDIEIHGLTPNQVERVLSQYGEIDLVGNSFGVYLVKGLDVDWSLPRKENSTGRGHKEFEVSVEPNMGIVNALQRRDFTMNAMAISMTDWNHIDPFMGKNDLQYRILRHVEASTFVEDPLRVLRGMQFASRFKLIAPVITAELCQKMVEEYYSLPRERIWEELKKMLLKGVAPSCGLRFLQDSGWIAHWPELARLFVTPQDGIHHPEGNVGVHTSQVIDEAARLRDDVAEEDQLVYMLACLLHDVGKPDTTYVTDKGRITSHRHDKAGGPIARRFLERVTNESDLIERTIPLIENHMFPHYCMPAGHTAYRRLQKKVDAYLLGKVCEADGLKPELEEQYYRMLKETGTVAPTGSNDTVVKGRHLIERGLTPGPEFGKIIEECEEVFLETGERNPSVLLDRVLGDE